MNRSESAVTEKSNSDKSQPKTSGGFFWPLLLILLGSIFLLNNFGFLPWTVWENLWRFWPVLLILWGLQLVLGRSRWSSLVITLISLIMFLLILLLSAAPVNKDLDSWVNSNFPGWSSFRQRLTFGTVTKNFTVSQNDFQNISSRAIDLNIDSARFTVTDTDNADYLDVEATFPESLSDPQLNPRQENNKLLITFDETLRTNMMTFGRFDYNFRIGQATLPTDLAIELGSGSGTLDFSKQKLSNLKVKLGSGQLKANLTTEALPTTATFELGSGNISVDIPKETGLKVTHRIGSGRLKIRDQSVDNSGVFMSDNYQNASQKIELTITVGSGNISID